MFNIVPLILLFGYVLLTHQKDKAELLNRTTVQLNKAFDFILNDSIKLNVDGVFGVNVAYAHLHKALPKATDPNTKQKIEKLLSTALLISMRDTRDLPNFPYKYYVFNNYLIPSKLWERDINFSYGKLNPNLKVDPGPYNLDNIVSFTNYVMSSTFNEEQSDACFVEVATASEDTKLHDCPVSDTCADYMLKIPTKYSSRFPGYGATHMALFLQIARSRNCNFDYEKVNKLLEEKCSYILWELRKNVEFGYIPNLEDIFIEQVNICGLEGFGEFLQKDYLEYILSVQDAHGGFGVTELTKQQLLNRHRPKRESVRMSYGANSHTTGLAVEALALFIRVLIEKPFSNKAFYE